MTATETSSKIIQLVSRPEQATLVLDPEDLILAYRAGRESMNSFLSGKGDLPCQFSHPLQKQEWLRARRDVLDQVLWKATDDGCQHALFGDHPGVKYSGKLKEAWDKGVRRGESVIAKTEPKELAWMRGWHAGAYSEGLPDNPYEETPLAIHWLKGYDAGLSTIEALASRENVARKVREAC
jgi:ribosome modulation factor